MELGSDHKILTEQGSSLYHSTLKSRFETYGGSYRMETFLIVRRTKLSKQNFRLFLVFVGFSC